jgi:hypothetical protein
MHDYGKRADRALAAEAIGAGLVDRWQGLVAAPLPPALQVLVDRLATIQLPELSRRPAAAAGRMVALRPTA